MKIHVYDTHVRTKANQTIHFDILVDDDHVSEVKDYAKQYLSSLGINPTEIVLNSCQFCHSEIANPEVQTSIKQNGHYVLPLN